jgi:ribose/xylose/arabinose/galactoside ABC-type transport system permease subunit
VPVRAATCASYAVSGLMAGLTAVLLSARLGSASANMGNDGVVLDVVSACVVGGVSIYGGSGYVTGAALGALVITLLSNNLNLLGVSYYLNLMTKGVVIIGFVALDGLRRRAS